MRTVWYDIVLVRITDLQPAQEPHHVTWCSWFLRNMYAASVVCVQMTFCRIVCYVHFHFRGKLFYHWHQVNTKGESSLRIKDTFLLAWCGYQSIVRSHFVPSNLNKKFIFRWHDVNDTTNYYRFGWKKHVLLSSCCSDWGSLCLFAEAKIIVTSSWPKVDMVLAIFCQKSL